MKVSFGKLAFGAVAIATLGYGVAQFRGPNGYSALIEKRRDMETLDRENKMLREEIRRLDTRIDKLSRDPQTQELEVRKRLGMVREGETVYVLQDAKQPVAKVSK